MNKELNLKIEDLFRWKGKCEITDSEGTVIETLYQRVIGDADIQKARIEALKASKLLRKALRDETSDEYLIKIPLEGEYTQAELIALIIFSKYSLLRQQAEMRTREERVKEPKGDATLEQQEEYIANLEEARKTYEEIVNKDIENQSKKIEEELSLKSYEEIFDEFVKGQIDLACRTRMMEIFNEFTVYYGTYKDENFKVRRFESIEDFRDLAPRVKTQIMDSYRNIELNLEEVKK